MGSVEGGGQPKFRGGASLKRSQGVKVDNLGHFGSNIFLTFRKIPKRKRGLGGGAEPNRK